MIDLKDITLIIHIIVFIIIIISIYTDTRYYKVLNKIIYPSMFLGIVVSVFNQGWNGVKSSVLGILLITLGLFIFYALNFLGAGDIKLLAAVGAFLGYKETIYISLYSFLGGGIIALILLIVRKNGKKRFEKLFNYLKLSFFLAKVLEYETDKNDKNSIFRFTYGVLIGYLIYLVEVYGVITLFKY